MQGTGGTAWDALVGTPVARFRVERVMAMRSWGAVLDARACDGEAVVLKVVRSSTTSEPRARLLREARLASDIRHPNVVPVVEFGEDAALSLAYVAMPRFNETLADMLPALLPMHPDAAMGIGLQIADGLAACHRARVVHRDVCPANVFVHRAEVVRLVLGDFGIARYLGFDDGLTATGRFVGTLAYCAPEQARSAKHVDERADVWSLGAMLYETLTGTHPLGDVTPAMLLDGMAGRPRPVQDLAPWVEPRLARLVHRMLERDRGRRFRDAGAVAAELRPMCPESLRPEGLTAVPCELRSHHAERAREIDAVGAGPDRRDEDMLEDQTIGGFELLRWIGRGATASLYEARARNGRHVAIKVLRRSWWMEQARAHARLRREAQALAAVEHPNVVGLLEVGHDGDHDLVYAAMQLVRGTDARRLFRQHAPLVPDALVRLFAQAARGIAAAHAQGVVHRDIKPANLLLAQDEHGVVTAKVADFGVARISSPADASTSPQTQSGAVVGSPAYMAPEQLRDASHADERSDVWSLCAALYEGLTGERPWGARHSFADLVLAIHNDRPQRLSVLAPWVQLELEHIVHRGLERDPHARWPNMSALAEALERLVESTTLNATELLTVTTRARAAPRSAWSSDGPVVARPRSRWLERAGWAFATVAASLMVESTIYQGEEAAAPPQDLARSRALESEPDHEPTTRAIAASPPRPAAKPNLLSPALERPPESVKAQTRGRAEATPGIEIRRALGDEVAGAPFAAKSAAPADPLRPPRSWP